MRNKREGRKVCYLGWKLIEGRRGKMGHVTGDKLGGDWGKEGRETRERT